MNVCLIYINMNSILIINLNKQIRADKILKNKTLLVLFINNLKILFKNYNRINKRNNKNINKFRKK